MKLETERKFLIVRPSSERLEETDGLSVRQIVQTYLASDGNDGRERRVRQITEDGRITHVFTMKENSRVSGNAVSREETEYEISPVQYAALLREAYSELTKTRYSFPYEGHTVEIDIYPDEIGGKELDGRAVLEVELEDGDEPVVLPPWICVLRELTGTRDFSNKKLARRVAP